MGCTSSRTTVVVTNIRKSRSKPSNFNGGRKDENNNDSASPEVRTDDENQSSTAVGKHNETTVHVTEQSREQEDHTDLKGDVEDRIKQPRSNSGTHGHDDRPTESELQDGQLESKPTSGHESPLIVAENEEDKGFRVSSKQQLHQDIIEDLSTLQKAEKSDVKKGKYQLFSSVDEFKDVDFHALHAPKEKVCSFEELANYLTKPYPSELFKARSIWRWVTANISYDTDAFFSRNITLAADENNALETGKAVCSGYSSLVSALCSCIGLECRQIHGYAKGYSYQLGDSFKGKDANHSWTAIRIQSAWWLFDFTWGTGYVSNEQEFVWEYGEHYFMTDPELFILDHYPKNDEWQLVERKYSLEEYERWAKFRKIMFYLDFGMPNNRNGLISSEDGTVEVTLSVNAPVQISSKLEYVENESIRTMSNYSFTYVKGDCAVFTARLPYAGRYYLNLYASRLSNESKKSYDSIAQYEIECKKPYVCPTPFPKTFSNWVPGYVLHEPMDGVLERHVTNRFRIEAYNVAEMHVCTSGDNSQWTALAETCKGMWEGDVTFGDNTLGASVVIKVEGQSSTKYNSILRYDVK